MDLAGEVACEAGGSSETLRGKGRELEGKFDSCGRKAACSGDSGCMKSAGEGDDREGRSTEARKATAATSAFFLLFHQVSVQI